VGPDSHVRSGLTPPDEESGRHHGRPVQGVDVESVAVGKSMREAKQEQQQLSKERQDREQPASPTSAANLPHIYNDAFARRAGEIIARAAAAYRRDNRR